VVLRELARAKVNLTLCVRGRLPSGYHALESLIAFADFGDEVTLTPDARTSVVADGPFADAISGENLVARAAEIASAACPGLKTGRFQVTKHIPVAAGLGGGSADAAAALRLLARLNAKSPADQNWSQLAAGVGADVPVCLVSRTAIVSGSGERIALGPDLPQLWVVLVNALSTVPADKTRRVFAALDATAIDAPPPPPAAPGAGEFRAWLESHGNDLEPAAEATIPGMGTVRQALAEQANCRLARMSGAGPTWLGLFDDEPQARAAATSIAARHPGWWVCASCLGGAEPASPWSD
jgi:4-diphosphocytidyl-2-C-methyl-D-erythritol kinase